jgi:hypothetical protein
MYAQERAACGSKQQAQQLRRRQLMKPLALALCRAPRLLAFV